MDRHTEIIMIRAAKNNDSSAIAAVARIIYRTITQTLWIKLHIVHHDLAQDLLSKCLSKLPKFNDQYPIIPWVKAIVFNHMANLHERIPKMIDLKPEHNIGDLQAEVEHKDLLNRLKRAITSLPQSYQTVVNLYYFEGKTFKEIGQLTNRSANCSCKILKRAIKKLKLILN